MTGVGYAHGDMQPDSIGRGALHLAIRNVGISFGNAPRVHGLRLNWRDRGLERVDGLSLTVLALDESPRSVIRGVAINLLGGAYAGGLGQNIGLPQFPWVAEVDGLTVSPFSINVANSRGIVSRPFTLE